MPITTKDAAGLVAGGIDTMPNPNVPKSIFVTMRPAGGGTSEKIELKNGMKFKAVRGFGIKGESIEIGRVLTIGKEIDFELAAFLVNTSKVVRADESTPFDRPSESKAKK